MLRIKHLAFLTLVALTGCTKSASQVKIDNAIKSREMKKGNLLPLFVIVSKHETSWNMTIHYTVNERSGDSVVFTKTGDGLLLPHE